MAEPQLNMRDYSKTVRTVLGHCDILQRRTLTDLEDATVTISNIMQCGLPILSSAIQDEPSNFDPEVMQAIQINPEMFAAHSLLSEIFLAQGEKDKALAE
jgi:hypothetical protein